MPHFRVDFTPKKFYEIGSWSRIRTDAFWLTRKIIYLAKIIPFIQDKCCHLTLCLHLIEPHYHFLPWRWSDAKWMTKMEERRLFMDWSKLNDPTCYKTWLQLQFEHHPPWPQSYETFEWILQDNLTCQLAKFTRIFIQKVSLDGASPMKGCPTITRNSLTNWALKSQPAIGSFRITKIDN